MQWVVLDNLDARSKVSQALRDCPVSSVASTDLMFQAVESVTMNKHTPIVLLDDLSSKEAIQASDITENDVLFGRGGVTNNHIGNRRYRSYVQQQQEHYFSKPKMEKSQIANYIVAKIRQENGRFLKKDGSRGGLWFDVGDRRAREKTSQALREKAPQLKSVFKAAKSLLESKRATSEPSTSQKIKIISPTTTQSTHPSLTPYSSTGQRRKTEIVLQEDIREFDVCCGRGAGVNNLRGNKFFRKLVSDHCKNYFAASKKEKSGFSQLIIDGVHSKGGRFLKRNDDGFWCEISDSQAIVKTSQAFREHSSNLKEELKLSSKLWHNKQREKPISGHC